MSNVIKKPKKKIEHDPALMECPCDTCYEQLKQLSMRYIFAAEYEKSLNRLTFLLQAALCITIVENLLIAGVIIGCWLGWL